MNFHNKIYLSWFLKDTLVKFFKDKENIMKTLIYYNVKTVFKSKPKKF